MSKKVKKPRNYRATDATHINVAASRKRHTTVLTRLARLERKVSAQHRRIGAIYALVKKAAAR